MSTALNTSAHCYVGYIKENPVCFFAVLHFPHPRAKNFKKGHRLVVLPDYQGLGIGHQFSTAIAEYYKQSGYRFVITSSTKSLYKQRSEDPRWIVTRKGRTGPIGYTTSMSKLQRTLSSHKLTFSYEFIGLNTRSEQDVS